MIKCGGFYRRMSLQRGYLLPVTIALGLGIGTISVLGIQVVGQNAAIVNNQYYTALAKEAAQAGIAAAANCIISNDTTWSVNNTTLTPETGCNGVAVTGKSATLIDNATIQTTYSVGQLQDISTSSKVVTSTGTVKIKGPLGVIVKSFSHNIRTYAQTSQASTNRVSKPVDQLSVGRASACALAKGWVYCWGYNSNGQLGSAKLLQGGYSDSPVAVANGPIAQQPAIPAQNGFAAVPARPATAANPMSGKTVTKISVGYNHACAVANGAAYCWGGNGSGQLGNSSYTDSDEPVAVTTTGTPLDGKTVVDISAGYAFTCAVTSEGKVACWGYNANGQLGFGDVTNIYVANYNYPVNTSNPNSRGAIAQGVYCFLGCVPIAVAYTVPPSVIASKKIVKLARAESTATTMCAIDDTGQSYCWGHNNIGQVGKANNTFSGTDTDNGSCGRNTPANMPVPAFDIPDVLQPTPTAMTYPTDSIYTYPSRTVFKTSASSATTPNRLYSWSDTSTSSTRTWSSRVCGSTGGQSGAGVNKHQVTTTLRYTFSASVPAAPLYNDPAGTTLNLKQLSLSDGNAYNGLFCAMTGIDLYCDAHTTTNYGQTGSNLDLASAIPAGPQHVYMDGWLLGKTILDVQVGDWFACVLTDQGVGCWGYNSVGQLGDNSVTNRNVPVGIDIGVTSGIGEDVAISSNATFGNPISF